MDEFCGSEFWNTTLTWHSEDPDLTPCFQQTVLIWTPCAFVWLFSILDIYYIRASRNTDIPWSWKNISKLTITGMLIFLTIIDLGMAINKQIEKNNEVFPVHIYTPIIKIATFVIVNIIVRLNQKHGLQTSGLMFMFWFFLVVCSIPRCRTEARNYNADTATSWQQYQYISFMIYFASSIIVLIINCFADSAPQNQFYPKTENPCPELGSSFLSRMFYSWFDKLAWKGYRNPLETKDLWQMNPEDTSKEIYPRFSKYWNNSLDKSLKTKVNQINSRFSKDESSVKFVQPKQQTKGSVVPVIFKAFGPTFIFGSVLKLFQDLLTFASPQILRLLIAFVSSDEPLWKGLLYAALLFIVAATQTLLLAQYFNRMFLVGLRIRTALICAIYRKALIMSNSSRKESTVGEIVNLMSVDAQRFMDLTTYINLIWSAPLQIVLSLYFLWDILGPSVLAGLAVMIILIPVNAFIANKLKSLQIEQMKNKDERVKLMNEILSGIKVLKLYAWEPSFEDQVFKIRDKEIKVLRKAALYSAGTSFVWNCAPFLVALTTFATYVLIDENNVLDATTAFVSLALFNVLRFPLSMLPMLISNLVQTIVSVKRVNKFMNCEELDPENVQNEPSEKHPLTIENGSFSWGGEDLVLKNINMQIEIASLVAVVGTVGSGKSSLISAYLGEMDKVSGRVNATGSAAYVSQQAWIQNATLQDNIIFGKPLDRKLYDRVIEACALKPDIEMLPGGDQTEIGEKGINLSGGQKQRVSLARAVYNDADIYYLDDPLSAVDSHVGKHIFEHVIGPNGLLANKTRILVTHGITYLSQVNHIYVLKDGEISESGKYQELIDKKGAFSEFLIQYLQEVDEDEEDLDEIKQQLDKSINNDELRGKFERAISRSKTTSESNSDTGSIRRSISRQTSTISDTESSLMRRRSSDNLKTKKKAADNKLIDQEQAQIGTVKMDVFKHYFKSVGIPLVISVLLLNIILRGFAIGSNFTLSYWSTDSNVANDTSIRNMYLGLYGALGAGQALTNLAASLIMAFGFVIAAKEMHTTLLTNVLRWSMDLFDTTPLGRILNRFSKDIDVIDNTLPMVISSLIMMFFTVIATFVVISISSPLFMTIILPVAVIYVCLQRFYVATSRQLKRLESVSRSPIYSHFSESITGAPTIRAYRVVNRFEEESQEKVDINQVCYYPSIIANRWLAVRLEMVGNLIILFAAIFAVLGRGTINAGLVGLSVTYALEITQVLNWVVRMTSEVETNIVAVERIKEYTETKQEAPWQLENSTLPTSWPDNGRVEFKNFQVRYREGLELVLKGISFVVEGGEKVGIVGRTGAGKSSLTLALFRIIESAGGNIIIDGVDISTLGLHELRSRLTIIPQDPVLFSGTLRINLDPFNVHSDDDLWSALEHAHLKAFVKGLVAGINHKVTEGGENLSVGQRQLICLARALLRKTKVLVLDEATAAVDLETDDLIQRTIRTEFKDCTVLTIAHRLNTIMDSDKVLVLDKGHTVEFSSPQELLKNKTSIFYGMAKDAGLV